MSFKRAGLFTSLFLLSFSGVAPSQEEDVASETNVAELVRIGNRLRIESQAERQEARRMAPLLGIPIRGLTPEGGGFELMAIRNSQPYYYVTDNLNAAISTRADTYWPGGSTGLDLVGALITLNIWDQGTVRDTHQELDGGVTKGDLEAVNGNHATHVGGTMIGWGVDGAARGMTRGFLRSFGWGGDQAEMAAEAATGMRLSNHSYGGIAGYYINPSFNTLWSWVGDTAVSTVEDYGFGYYDSGANAWDNICYNAPYYLPVKSAGNNRNSGPAAGTAHYHGYAGGTTFTDIHYNQATYDTLPYIANAKNILVIGAVDDVLEYADASSVVMSNFSSWGPTDDGRIKPDLVGNGVGVYSSTAVSDTSYASLNGTSMASPNVTGTLGLILEHWRNTHNKDLKAATMKALVIHSARAAGTANGPDYTFGWGLLDAVWAAQYIFDDVTLPHTITERRLVNGKPHIFWVFCPDTPAKIKATIAWTDKPGTVETATLDSTTSKLVNDLDLRIVKPGVGSLGPFRLDPASPGDPATIGDNFRDNVEQVQGDLFGVAGGWVRVTVNHKGTLSSPNYQDYSLIITGTSKILQVQKVILPLDDLHGGTSWIGKVQLTDKAPDGGVQVSLASDHPRVTVPAFVTVPGGSRVGIFTITAKPVGEARAFKITASILPSTKSEVRTVVP